MSKKHSPADQPDPAIKPAVIDLAAEDVTPAPEDVSAAAKETAAAPAGDAPPPRRKAPALAYSGKWLVAALIGGGLLGGWLYRDVLSQWLPSNEMTALTNKVAALEVQDKSALDQIAGLSGQISSLSGDISRIEGVANDVTARTVALSDATGQTTAQLAQRLTALENNLAEVKNLVALASPPAAVTGGAGVPPAALAALAQRVEALEKDVASLKAPSADSGSAIATMTAALADLKARIASGQPYEAEFARIQHLVPAAPGLDVLGPQARLGLPDAAGLAAELKAAIPGLPAPQAASQTPAAEPGFMDRLWNRMTSLVTIRNEGDSNWPELAEKAANQAAAGELSQAIATLNQGGDAKPNALLQWRDRAQARIDLEAALAAVSEAVMRTIAAKG